MTKPNKMSAGGVIKLETTQQASVIQIAKIQI